MAMRLPPPPGTQDGKSAGRCAAPEWKKDRAVGTTRPCAGVSATPHNRYADALGLVGQVGGDARVAREEDDALRQEVQQFVVPSERRRRGPGEELPDAVRGPDGGDLPENPKAGGIAGVSGRCGHRVRWLIQQNRRKGNVPGQAGPVQQILMMDALARRRGYAKPALPYLPPLSAAIPTGYASFCPGFVGRLVHARGMPACVGSATPARDGHLADDADLRNGFCRQSRLHRLAGTFAYGRLPGRGGSGDSNACRICQS